MQERRKEGQNGRREVDRIGTCIYHDICHETVAQIKQNCIDVTKSNKDSFDKMAKTMDMKLPTWIFKLFLSTTIPVAIALGGWLGYNAFETREIVTVLHTNQQHMIQELALKPVKK